jgi:hypothetical protein
MAITTNIIVGVSDIHNEPDAILFRSSGNPDHINVQVVSSKFAVNHEDILNAITIVKDFVQNRQPIDITKETLPTIVYGEDDNN